MIEVACELNKEPAHFCDIDQRSFKAYLSRFLVLALKMAPYTQDLIMPKIQTSALAAAKNCRGAPDGTTCSLRWSTDDWISTYTGIGEQMAALEVFQSNLQHKVGVPVTAAKGGTSKGDPNAGLNDDKSVQPLDLSPIETKDRVGAGFLTAAVLAGVLGGTWWLMF